MKKLILGVTIGGSSRLLDGQPTFFKSMGFDVSLISQKHPKEVRFCEKEGIRHLPILIDNQINPFYDFLTIYQIVKAINKIKPDIINVGTPKMGLLGILGALLAGVKNRIYTCRGLRFETESGIKRTILQLMEKLTVRMASRVIYVSPSLMEAAKRYGTCQPSKSLVIGKGSSNGVDIELFKKDRVDQVKRKELILHYGLEGKTVIGFIGRVSVHKGIRELLTSFERLQKTHPNIVLMMVGHLDCSKEIETSFRNNPSIIHVPFQDDVPLYMSLIDIFVLPSWREGFPNVPIQAAAMGLPVIVSNATGCIDAISPNFNGLLFEQRDANSLAETMLFYLDNPEERKRHGNNGISWASNFTNKEIWNGLHQLYQTLN